MLEGPDVDAAIVEIGGTVGDIESQPFLEAIRQVGAERGRQNVMVSASATDRYASWSPTYLPTRAMVTAPAGCSLFCNIPVDHAIPNLTAELLYEVPLMLEREGLADVVVRRLGLICHAPDLTEWATMVHRAKHPAGAAWCRPWPSPLPGRASGR